WGGTRPASQSAPRVMRPTQPVDGISDSATPRASGGQSPPGEESVRPASALSAGGVGDVAGETRRPERTVVPPAAAPPAPGAVPPGAAGSARDAASAPGIAPGLTPGVTPVLTPGMTDERFEELVKELGPVLRRMAASRTVQRADADDLYGETLLHAWKGRGSY